MNRLYSFVLPAYKAKFLGEAIDSILAQTYTNFELIIVNDASPEDLESIVKLYDDPRIQYYTNKVNVGGKDLIAQWNYSITYAKGEYLILASDDDIYEVEYLEKMDKLVCKYPYVHVFRPRVQLIDSNGEVIGVEGYLNEYSTTLEFLYAWVNNWTGSGVPFYIFRRDALINKGGFAQYPLAWFADDATVLRMSDTGIVTLNEVLFSFRWSGLSITSKPNQYSTLKEKINATNLFFLEGFNYISNYKEIDEYTKYLKKHLLQSFPRFMLENKIIGQLSSAKWIDVWRSMSFVSKLQFVNKRYLLKWFIRFSCCRLLGR